MLDPVLRLSYVRTARIILTLVLAGQAISGFLLDWTPNHLLNPLWHPHARFHGALLLFFSSGVSGLGIWLLWRRSPEPFVGVTAAAAISASFWTPLFYITTLLPIATPWAGDPARVPHIAGHVFYPNEAVAGGALIVTAIGWAAARRARA